MGRAQPQGRNTQAVQVVQLVLDTLEVTNAVAVGVCKAVDEQLVGGVGALGTVKGGRSGHHGGFFRRSVGGLGHGQLRGGSPHLERHLTRTSITTIECSRYGHRCITIS